MKFHILTFTTAIFFCSQQSSFGQISFQKQYGASTMDEHGFSVVQAADSSYYVSGVRVSGSLPNIIGEAILTHTDKYGNEIWTKYYSTPDSDDLNFDYIDKTSDNKLIVAGTVVYDYAADYYDVYLSKIDLNGNVLWYKSYGGAYKQRGYQVKETFDNGFVIGGWGRTDGNPSSTSFHLIRTNNIGDTIWTRIYPIAGMHRGFAVEQTPDSGFVIAGSIDQSGQVGTDISVMKTDSSGGIVWTKTIDLPGTSEAKDIAISNDGNIVVSGWSTSTGCQAYILTELDQNGNTIWFQNYNTGFCAWNRSLHKTNDNGYALFGMNTNYDFYLVKTDSVGNQQWFKKFDENLEYGYDVKQTLDGGYIMAGDTYISNDSNVDLFLVKTDSLGNVLNTNKINNTSHESFAIYPNPADNILNLEIAGQLFIQKICLVDLQGRLVKEYTGNFGKLDVGDIAVGKYLLQVYTDQGKITKKIMVK